MMPIEHKDEIIQNGINFMRSITEAYGTDEGMKLWDTIANTLDPDIKGKIFFAMLTGDYNGVIQINSCAPGANKVSMIKAVRSVDIRRLGLKEAKDLVDALEAGKPMRLEIDVRSRTNVIRDLRAGGFNV